MVSFCKMEFAVGERPIEVGFTDYTLGHSEKRIAEDDLLLLLLVRLPRLLLPLGRRCRRHRGQVRRADEPVRLQPVDG